MPANNTEIEKRLWDPADELRANSRLKPSEYSVPVLGLIFLRYADHKFAHAGQEIEAEWVVHAGRRRQRPISSERPWLTDKTLAFSRLAGNGTQINPDQRRWALILWSLSANDLRKSVWICVPEDLSVNQVLKNDRYGHQTTSVHR